MDAALPFLAFLASHVYLVIFIANTIDAAGIPFPGRIVLILAAYRRFLAYDIAGSLVYATLWVMVGHVFGEQVSAVLAWLGRRRAIIMIVPAALLAIVAYRLWRRRRYGAARPELVSG